MSRQIGIIPEELKPQPAWVEGYVQSFTKAEDTLGHRLAACPPVIDERICAAIDLVVASRYEALPRSAFLMRLTALDSLAARFSRSDEICAWLDAKVKEAARFDDSGLKTSLENLKQGSHGAAIRDLVIRAAESMNCDEATTQEFKKMATRLYGLRSSLSHAGGAVLASQHIEDAKTLACFVIDTVVQHPYIIDG